MVMIGTYIIQYTLKLQKSSNSVLGHFISKYQNTENYPWLL